MQEEESGATSRSYLLPVEDTQFLLRDEMRSIRFALEYAKAELALRDWGIRSTIIVFGGARIPSPEEAEEAAGAARDAADTQIAERMRVQSKFYATAREFGRIASQRGGAFGPQHRWRDNVIATGGGPGIMEAANRGASDAGAPSIGFNIALPQEQRPNPYITPGLSFQFHYFAMRKMHLAMRASALAIFPGGVGESYWRKIVNFAALAVEGMISPTDLRLFEFAETAEEGWASLVRRGLRAQALDGR